MQYKTLIIILLIVGICCIPVLADSVTGSVTDNVTSNVTNSITFVPTMTPLQAVTVEETASIIAQPTVVELQGGQENLPVAYLGEYVDISGVVGWSDKLAFWYGTPSQSIAPDLIVDASSFQHRFYLDPAKFRVGTWYKWDGSYEPNGNMQAFEIKSGTRPAPTPVPTLTITAENSTLNVSISDRPTNDHIYLARGDQEVFSYYYKGDEKNGYLWLFSNKQSILGIQMTPTKADSHIFEFTFDPHLSQSLPTGVYTGYMQFCDRQDVFYNRTANALDSPFKSVPAKSISGFDSTKINALFTTMEQNSAYTDDVLIPVSAEIVDPAIQFTDYYEESNDIIVQGKSTMSVGTPIGFLIDPSQHPDPRDAFLHTTYTRLTGTIDSFRQFYVRIPVDWDNIAIGDHVVFASINNKTLNINMTQYKDFKVTTEWVNPTPTAIAQKVVVDTGGWHHVNATNGTSYLQNDNGSVVTIPTPQYIYVNVTQTPIIIYMAQTTSPLETQTTESSAVLSELPIAGLIIVAYIVIKRK
jgi:hypothetical protein